MSNESQKIITIVLYCNSDIKRSGNRDVMYGMKNKLVKKINKIGSASVKLNNKSQVKSLKDF